MQKEFGMAIKKLREEKEIFLYRIFARLQRDLDCLFRLFLSL